VSHDEVLEGLKAGERIVVRGADRVRDGQQVS
jgi:multidrug efflux pump subunit AcrA (membrane-fusion protein)